MPYADVPTRAELVSRFTVLRERPEEAIAVLSEAGVFRLRVPRRHGGYECDTRTLVGVAVELGRVSGVAAWLACEYWTATWLVFGDEAVRRPSTMDAVRAVMAASAVGVVVGIAQDARDWFFEGLVTDHGSSFAGGPGGFPPALAHVQTADALSMITEAERHAYRLATLVDTTTVTAWTDHDSARASADLAETCRLAGDAVHILAATNGSGPIRRTVRDLDDTTRRVLSMIEA